MALTPRSFGSGNQGGNEQIALGFVPVAGNLLLCFVSRRNGGTPSSAVGNAGKVWTALAPTRTGTDSLHVYYRVADGAETTFGITWQAGGGTGAMYAYAEIPAPFDIATLVAAIDGSEPTGAAYLGPAATPPGGRGAIVLGYFYGRNEGPVGLTATPAGGWTDAVGVIWNNASGAWNHPLCTLHYRTIAAPVGSYQPAGTWSDAGKTWAGVTVTVSELASGSFRGEPGGGVW